MKQNEKNHRSGARVLGAVMALALLVPGVPARAAGETYPKCAASYESLVDALASVGADASFASRKEIAESNGVSGYTGTAAQNILLLNLLKNGALRTAGAASAAPLDTNLAKARYIAQDAKTCKASAVAMAVNLLRGNNDCTTAGMGGSCCRSIDGVSYTGSDGRRYKGSYKTDSYIGSAAELTAAIDAALAAGVPAVAAVHSTAGGTKHHWVVVVGKSGDDYLVVDPACGSAGAMAANVRTLSARSYAFGLTDYSTPHYGYVTFTAV